MRLSSILLPLALLLHTNSSTLSCSQSTDCPPEHICISAHCQATISSEATYSLPLNTRCHGDSDCEDGPCISGVCRSPRMLPETTCLKASVGSSKSTCLQIKSKLQISVSRCSDPTIGSVCDTTSLAAFLQANSANPALQTASCVRLQDTIPNGQPCRYDANCLSQQCVNGICAGHLDVGQHCELSAACKPPNICYKAPGNSYSSCGPYRQAGEECDTTVSTCAAGLTCSQPVTVTDGICEATIAGQSVCDGANPCNPFSQYCEGGVCKPLPSVEYEVCHDTSNGHICAEGFYCSGNNRCKTAKLASCTEHVHCPVSHACVYGSCVARDERDCSADTHDRPDHRLCVPTKYCWAQPGGRFLCRDRTNDLCSTDAECFSNSCIAGKCVFAGAVGSACNGADKGCINLGVSASWARCNVQQTPTCQSLGGTDSVCATSSNCLNTHFCHSGKCKTRAALAQACSADLPDNCVTGAICHRSKCVALLSLPACSEADSAQVCESGALYNGVCERLDAPNQKHCSFTTSCVYNGHCRGQQGYPCRCGSTSTAFNGHCPSYPGMSNQIYLLHALKALNVLSSSHFTGRIAAISSTLASLALSTDAQRQLYYIAVALCVRVAHPQLDGQWPFIASSFQLCRGADLLPTWAQRFIYLDQYYADIKELPDCTLHEGDEHFDSIHFHPFMTPAELETTLKIIALLTQKLCQKDANYQAIATVLSQHVQDYLRHKLPSQQAYILYDAIRAFAWLSARRYKQQAFLSCIDALNALQTGLNLEVADRKAMLAQQVLSLKVQKECNSALLNILINLALRYQSSVLTDVQQKIKDWISLQLTDQKSKGVLESAKLIDVCIRGATVLSQFNADFPVRRDSNYYRNFHFDFPPFSPEIQIANTRTTLTAQTSPQLVMYTDMQVLPMLPSLPSSGCGMADVGNAALAGKMQHRLPLLISPVGGSGLEFAILYTEARAVVNSFTPACCLELPLGSSHWVVTGQATQRSGNYRCVHNLKSSTLVAMGFYSETGFKMTKEKFVDEVYFMVEAELREVVATVRRSLSKKNTPAFYQDIIVNAASCMDALQAICTCNQSLHAMTGSCENIDEELDTSRRYIYECLEMNYFSDMWDTHKACLQKLESWACRDISQDDHIASKLDVTRNTGESNPVETEKEVECETVFIFFPMPGFLFFEEYPTKMLNVTYIRAYPQLNQALPQLSKIIFNEYLIHQEQLDGRKIHSLVSLGFLLKDGSILQSLETPLSGKARVEIHMFLRYDAPGDVECARVSFEGKEPGLSWEGVTTVSYDDTGRLLCTADRPGLYAAVSVMPGPRSLAVLVPIAAGLIISLTAGFGLRRASRPVKRLTGKMRRWRQLKSRFPHLQRVCCQPLCGVLAGALPGFNLLFFYDQASRAQVLLRASGCLFRIALLITCVCLGPKDLFFSVMAGACCLFPNSALRQCLARRTSDSQTPLYFEVSLPFLRTTFEDKASARSDRAGSETARKLSSLPTLQTEEATAPLTQIAPPSALLYSSLKAPIIIITLFSFILLGFSVFLSLHTPVQPMLISLGTALLSGYIIGALKVALEVCYLGRGQPSPQQSRGRAARCLKGLLWDAAAVIAHNERALINYQK